MPSLDTIRTLTIKATADGVDDATKSLQALADAQGGVAVASDTMTKSTLSVSNQVDKLSKSLDPAYKASANLRSEQTTLGKGLDQGAISLDRYNQLTALATQRFNEAAGGLTPFQVAIAAAQEKASSLSGSLGPLGNALTAIGPAGLAIGAAIGVAVLALDAMSNSADELAAKAQNLSNFAQVTGLATDQVQALTETAAKFGNSTDSTERFVDSFTAKLTQLRTAAGPLYDAIVKVDAGIAQQMLTAKSTTEELDLYAQAYKIAAAAGNGNQLLVAAGGRNAVTQGPLIGSIADAGGLDALNAAMDQGSRLATDLITQLKNLKAQNDSLKDSIQNNIASLFSSTILQTQVEARTEVLQITTALKDFHLSGDWTKFVSDVGKVVSSDMPSWLSKLGNAWSLFGLNAAGVNGTTPGASQTPTPDIIGTPYPSGVVTRAPLPATPTEDPVATANKYKALEAVLGSAATVTDQFNAKLAALVVAARAAGVPADQLAATQAKLSASLDASGGAAAAFNKSLNALDLDKIITQENLHNAALGAGATIAQQVQAKNDALQRQQLQGASLSDTEYANTKRLNQAQADGTFALQAQIDAMKVQAATIGMSVGQAETFTLVQTKINENLNAGRPALDGITAGYLQMAIAAGQTKQAQAELAAQTKANFDLQTVFLSSTEQQIASVQQQLHGNAWPQFMNDGLSATLRITAALKDLQTNADTFATDLAHGLEQGKTLTDSLAAAATNLGQKLIDSGITTLLNAGLNSAFSSLTGSGASSINIAGGATALTAAGATLATSITTACATGAAALTTAAATISAAGAASGVAIGAGGSVAGVGIDVGTSVGGAELVTAGAGAGAALAAGGAAAGTALWGPLAAVAAIGVGLGLTLFGSSNSATDALNQAKAAWAAMTTQVDNFNEAAKGFSLGPLTQELQSLSSTLLTLQTAALKANDLSAVAGLDQSFGNAVLRIVDEFKNGTDVLTPFATALKSLNDEAGGLEDTLNSLNVGSLANQVAISAGAQATALAQQFADSLTTSLQQRINTANGQDYLNSASTLLTNHQQDILQAQQLGVSMDLVNQTFAAEAQKIVNDASLTGDAFTQFVTLFPQLAGVVTEASSATAAAVATVRSATDIASAQQSAQDRLFAASNDTSTYAGAIAAAVRTDQQQQAAEVAAGGQAINDLVAAQQQELRQIYWKFENQQLADAQSFADRIFAASNDTSTYQGAIAAAVLKDQEEQATYIAQGGQDINGLVAAQQAELNAIYWQFTNAAIAAAQAATDAAASRLQGYQDTLFSDTNDTSTLQGQLAAFDRQAQQQLLAEQQAGGQDAVQLEQIQSQERLAIISKFNDAAVAAQQQALDQVEAAAKQFTSNILTYLESLKTGADSTLSPQDKVTAAQNFFNTDIAAAGRGDTDAQSRLTQDATTLLDLAKAFYTSSTSYTDIYNGVTASLQKIAGLPVTTGMVGGGLVGNGIFGVDSVLASFAGGGNIALAGGEFVMPAAQTSANLPALEAMRSGSFAANDNGAQIAALGQQLVRAMVGVSVSEMTALRDDNAQLRDLLSRAVRALEAKPAPARPNQKRAAA